MANPAYRGADPMGTRARAERLRGLAMDGIDPTKLQPGSDLPAYAKILTRVGQSLDFRAASEPLGSGSRQVLRVLAGLCEAGVAAIEEIEVQEAASRQD